MGSRVRGLPDQEATASLRVVVARSTCSREVTMAAPSARAKTGKRTMEKTKDFKICMMLCQSRVPCR